MLLLRGSRVVDQAAEAFPLALLTFSELGFREKVAEVSERELSRRSFLVDVSDMGSRQFSFVEDDASNSVVF